MFEDLIKKKTMEYNTKTQCPHCRTRAIIKYLVQGVMNGKRKQEAYCPMCAKRWYIIHDEDMSGAHVQFIKHKPSVLVP